MTNEQWFWMMNWCKSRGLPPADEKVWEEAKEAYKQEYGNKNE